jgi:hypothetical protein
MSVALLITDARNEAAKRLIPVATQEIFRSRWLPGAAQLGLEWVELMETGLDVTPENRDELLAELGQLRAWMVGALGDGSYELERLDRLVEVLKAVEFADGISVFLG